MSAEASAAPGELTFAGLMVFLLRSRRVLLVCALTGLVLGVAAARLRSPRYSVSASFTPQTSTDQGRGGLAGLAGMAGSLGVSLGGLSGAALSPQFYAELLKTRDVLVPIVRDSFPGRAGAAGRRAIPELLDVGGETAALREERASQRMREKVLEVGVSAKTGIVSVKVTTTSPELSLSLAQRLLEELNRYNLRTRQSQAGAERKFAEARLAEARISLREGEDQLQRFMQTNRSYQGAPDLVFQQSRLEREVATRQQLVVSLAQAHEESRLREVRDTPVITVVESARLPALPDSRFTVIFGLVGLMLGSLLALAYAIVRESVRSSARSSSVDSVAFTEEVSRLRRSS
ncbi:MAG: hypothetical protein IT355_09955 [Gemmatimonadaceae bacterium]|nr:hypothetical protein [Gemmatimonadaceae bacterium]